MFNNNLLIQRLKNKKKAIKNFNEMKMNFSFAIFNSICNTIIYTEENIFDKKEIQYKNMKIDLKDCTTVEAIKDETKRNPNDKIVALNFASYIRPGGIYLKGAIAQEESLCHASFLYNVLASFKDNYYEANKKQLNRGLYTNKALYSKDIYFFDDNNCIYQCDVITCAAPNYGEAKKYGISKEENEKVLENRMRFIIDIALEQNAQILILGAWGCGVFKQDAKTIAKLFQKLLKNEFQGRFKEVIFAVPKSKDENYEDFHEIFS